jgi:2-polyprenyl-3-methyl-5-hydroxy-6-metoxy-1,4-benzoquinol methylase
MKKAINCPICDTKTNIVELKITWGKNTKRCFCTACGTYFIWPEPAKTAVYDTKYNEYFHRPGDARKAGIMAERIAQMIYQHEAGHTILEVGCGNAWTLWLLKQIGFDVTGHELSEEYALKIAREKKLDMLYGDFEYTVYNNEYDFIYAGHVIEHSWYPKDWAIQCNNLLKNKGYVYIDTPTLEFYDGRLGDYKHFRTRNPEEHAVIFSSKSLKFLLEKHGFKIQKTTFEQNYHSVQILAQKVENE